MSNFTKSPPVLFLCISLALCLTACGSTTEPPKETNDSYVGTTDNSSNEVSNKMNDNEEVISKVESDDTTSFHEISFGETQTLDFVEFTIDGASSGDEIKPANPQNVYTYESDLDGEKYIYIYGTIKNISGDQFEFADNMYAKMTFDDKYNYRASIIADEDGSFSYIYAYLDPLKSERFYIIASVPDEMENQYSKVNVKFGFAENFDGEYNIQEDECDYLYSITVTK